MINIEALIQDLAKLRNKADGHDYLVLDRAISVLSSANKAGLMVMEPKPDLQAESVKEAEFLKHSGITRKE